jgi:hypothetical protein
MVAGSTATITSCTFHGGAGSHTDSVLNNVDGKTTFACPAGTTGTPRLLSYEEELEASQLPPRSFPLPRRWCVARPRPEPTATATATATVTATIGGRGGGGGMVPGGSACSGTSYS